MPNQLLRVLLTGAVVFFLFARLFCVEKGFRPLVMEVTDWQHLEAKFLFAVFKGIPHNASLQVWFESCVYLPLFDESDSGSIALGSAKSIIRIATCFIMVCMRKIRFLPFCSSWFVQFMV